MISGAVVATLVPTRHVTENQSETKRHDQQHRDQFCFARKHGATLPDFHPASKPNIMKGSLSLVVAVVLSPGHPAQDGRALRFVGQRWRQWSGVEVVGNYVRLQAESCNNFARSRLVPYERAAVKSAA
jgi:hypothetical protein